MPAKKAENVLDQAGLIWLVATAHSPNKPGIARKILQTNPTGSASSPTAANICLYICRTGNTLPALSKDFAPKIKRT
jgi:hypothetical protein